jgi:RNA polymerase sigma-70 factor (ECF subfamily)
MDDGREQRQRAEAGWPELMAKAQRGDSVAYDRLLREILPGLRAFVGSRLNGASSAEDVVQNVLFSIHRARHTYQPGRPFGPWLRAIARNAAADSLRARVTRNRREVPLSEAETLPDMSEPSPLTRPLSPRLAEALDSLPDNQRQAVELIHLRELSVVEAAEKAGITPGALKVRAHRGYKALRAALGDGES